MLYCKTQIFQPRHRDIWMIIKFVAETAKILRKNSRLQQLVFLADRSIELFQGNLEGKKFILSQITIGDCFDIEQYECTDLLKYYHAFEEMLDDSVVERKFRTIILLQIGKAYILTADYRKTLEYTLKAEKITNDIETEVLCCENLGIAYFSLGEYEKAITYYEKGLKISSAFGDRSGIANDNGNLGNVYHSLGEYEKAITYYEIGLEISSAIGDHLGIACQNGNLGSAYVNLAEYNKAITYLEKGLQIGSAIGDLSGIAGDNGNLGNAYLGLGEYDKAITYYEKGLEITSAIGDRLGIASNNGNLGNVYRSLGEYEKAITYYEKGLEISSAIGDRSGIARHNGNLGSAYFNLGEYHKAITCFEKGLEISSAIGDLSGIAGNNGNLGNAYLSLGEYEKPISYYEIGLQISSGIGGRSEIAISNGNLGNAYRNLGEYGKAVTYYEKGLEISSAIGSRSGIATNNGNLGNAYLSLGEYDKAITYYEKGLEIFSAIGDRFGIARINVNLGNAYSSLGEYEKAIEFSMQGLKVSVEICDPNNESLCLRCIGVIYFLKAQSQSQSFSAFQQAKSYLTRSIQCRDQIFSNLVFDQNKISFAEQYFSSYMILMRCFIFLKRIEAALLVIDLGKAKALHAFMVKVKMSKTDIGIDLTWKRIDNGEEKLRTVEFGEALELKPNSSVLFYTFDDEKFLHILVLNSENVVKTFKHIKFFREIIDKFLNILLINFEVVVNRNSSFYTCTHGFPMVPSSRMNSITENIKSADVAKQVEPTEFGKLETTLHSSPSPNLPLDKNRSSNNISTVPILDTENVFRLLYQVLIHPVQEFIKGTKIIIVPDKCLFFVPFCSLLDENDCRLSKNFSVQMALSLHTLLSSMTRPRDCGLGFALFVGNPTVGKVSFCGNEIEPSLLPSASEEVEYLAPLFEAQPLVERKATKERVLKYIPGASIIHIAAHGEGGLGEIFLTPNPNMTEQTSSLPKENSYLLKQRDILKIGTNARLVVLCCCHTGKGKISSEGVVGLARAFLCVGARSVLATLWSIHDKATRGLMQIFYDEICKGTSVCEALRKAMNIFQKHGNEEFRSFKIWAPFTIYGEDMSFSKDDIEEIKRKSGEANFLQPVSKT